MVIVIVNNLRAFDQEEISKIQIQFYRGQFADTGLRFKKHTKFNWILWNTIIFLHPIFIKFGKTTQLAPKQHICSWFA